MALCEMKNQPSIYSSELSVGKFPGKEIQTSQPGSWSRSCEYSLKCPRQPHIHPKDPDLDIIPTRVDSGSHTEKYHQQGTVHWRSQVCQVSPSGITMKSQPRPPATKQWRQSSFSLFKSDTFVQVSPPQKSLPRSPYLRSILATSRPSIYFVF